MNDTPMNEKNLDNFIGDILVVCFKGKYSNDVVIEGLEFCLTYISEKIDEAHRENERENINEIR